MGSAAERFLIKVLRHEPFTKDNELAATALLFFPLSEQLSGAFLEVLANPKSHANHQLSLYLVLGCEGLKDAKKREEFKTIIKLINNPEIHTEADYLVKNWK